MKRQTQRQTDRDKQTDRETDTQRQTDREWQTGVLLVCTRVLPSMHGLSVSSGNTESYTELYCIIVIYMWIRIHG